MKNKKPVNVSPGITKDYPQYKKTIKKLSKSRGVTTILNNADTTLFKAKEFIDSQLRALPKFQDWSNNTIVRMTLAEAIVAIETIAIVNNIDLNDLDNEKSLEVDYLVERAKNGN